MIARQYNLKPVLFGCDPELTTTRDKSSPIVAYFTNAPWSYYSNFSWTQPATPISEFNRVLENSFNILTRGNSTVGHGWAECVGCAVIDRSLGRANIRRPDFCDECFREFCWDGKVSNDVPQDPIFDPSLVLYPNVSYAEAMMDGS